MLDFGQNLQISSFSCSSLKKRYAIILFSDSSSPSDSLNFWNNSLKTHSHYLRFISVGDKPTRRRRRQENKYDEKNVVLLVQISTEFYNDSFVKKWIIYYIRNASIVTTQPMKWFQQHFSPIVQSASAITTSAQKSELVVGGSKITKPTMFFNRIRKRIW